MSKKIGFKPLFLIILSGIIIISFIVLKVKNLYDSRDEIELPNNPSSTVLSDSVFSEKKTGLINGFNSYDEFTSFIEENKVKENNFSESWPDKAKFKDDDMFDLFSFDQNYAYILVEKELRIVKIDPFNDLELLGKINFDNEPIAIHLQDNNLVVFEEDDDNVFLKIFDVSDVNNIIELKDFKMEGFYFDSRLIDKHLYFIVNNYNNAFPRVFYQGEEFYFDCQDGLKCLYPDIYYFDADYHNGFNFSSVVSLDISNNLQEINLSSYLLPRPENIYMSSSNIYISYTKHFDEDILESEVLLELIYPRLSQEDREIVDEVHNASEKVLSLKEKRSKVRQILDLYINFLSPSEKNNLLSELDLIVKERQVNLDDKIELSNICRLALFNGIIEPVAEGLVPGKISDQFSMREHKDYLSLLAIKDISWSKYVSDFEPSLDFYVLDDNMQISDKIKGLSDKGDEYSLALAEDLDLSVIFSLNQALFLIDLENLHQISFLEELRDLNYDEALYFYENNFFLALGLKNEKIELSLWNISDNSFQKKDSYRIEDVNSYSRALSDNLSSLWIQDEDVLVIPLTLFDEDLEGPINFDGLAVFSLSEEGIKMEGEIEHSAKRVFYFKDNLYSFSKDSFQVHSLENLSNLNTLEW